jgi:hypothetical protein
VTPAVEAAVAHIQAHFSDRLAIVPEDDGGARIRVEAMELGPPYAQAETWFGFTVSYLHPYGDIYPHYVRPDLSRLDGAPLGGGLHINNSFAGAPAVMVSRRTRLLGAAHPIDPVLKLLKVHQWLASL